MTDIDLFKSELYHLSIRLSADGFSFSIYLPSAKENMVFSTYSINTSYSMTANIKEMIAGTAILGRSFEQVNILVDSPRYTLIPFDLYEDEQTDELFYHNFPKTNNENILCNILGKSNISILFGIDKHAHQFIYDQFPKARIYSSISPLTEYFTLQSREHEGRQMYAHLTPHQMDIFAFDHDKLMLINSFSCKLLPDQVYYLLYVWKQLGFSQEKDSLYLSGKCTHKQALLVELHKFIRQISVMESPLALQTDQEIPFDIQTLSICE